MLIVLLKLNKNVQILLRENGLADGLNERVLPLTAGDKQIGNVDQENKEIILIWSSRQQFHSEDMTMFSDTGSRAVLCDKLPHLFSCFPSS